MLHIWWDSSSMIAGGICIANTAQPNGPWFIGCCVIAMLLDWKSLWVHCGWKLLLTVWKRWDEVKKIFCLSWPPFILFWPFILQASLLRYENEVAILLQKCTGCHDTVIKNLKNVEKPFVLDRFDLLQRKSRYADIYIWRLSQALAALPRFTRSYLIE